MIGAIIGDIVGSDYEFNNTSDYDFPLFAEGSDFTDDTICTVAVADAILNKMDYQTAIRKWCRQYPHPKGEYGSYFFNWVMRPDPYPYNSFGNGSAMRVSPVAWLFDNEKDVRKQAEASAAITHNHPEGIKGAEATAVAIFMARNGASKADIKAYISDRFGYDLDRSVSEIRKSYGFDVSCQGSVPESIICFLESTDYESAVRLAVSLGGDADTQGAITGSIAAAYYKEIPDMIFNNAWSLLTTEIQNTVSSFGTYLLRT